jgi:GTP-binding protein
MQTTAQDDHAVQRRAQAWARSARFALTASRLDQLPPPDRPEIAFVGRSNAGKSSAINALAERRGLAFASKTPGRTQHINLFDVGPADAPDASWADLPGYGYAAVARDAKLRWQQVMADYLAYRHSLAGVVMLVDARHGLTPLDQQLLRFVEQRVLRGEVRLLVLLTKADKLSRAEARRSLAQAQQMLAGFASEQSDIALVLFSALDRRGVDDVVRTLHGWVEPAARSPSTAASAE